ncbi:hypothetical protein CBL_12219 [Carabus blaptoides fortunei]
MDARSPVAAVALVADDGAVGTKVEAVRRSPTDVSAAAATRAARTPTRTARDASAASFRLAGRLPWWPSEIQARLGAGWESLRALHAEYTDCASVCAFKSPDEYTKLHGRLPTVTQCSGWLGPC